MDESNDGETEPAAAERQPRRPESERGTVSVESNGTQTVVTVDYSTVEIFAVVEPQASPNTVENAAVDAGRHLALSLNGPTPRTRFTLAEAEGDNGDREEVA